MRVCSDGRHRAHRQHGTRPLRARGDEVVALSRNRGRSRSAGLGKRFGEDRQSCRHRNTDKGGKPMSDLQAIADRVEIEALRGEFTDAGMMRDYDRFASLFTQDGAWRMPHINVEFVSREEIRAGIERLQGFWDYFVQTVHPGTIQLEGDTAVGRAYIAELGRMRDGSSHLNYSVYHDRYQRTPDGWKFTERVYEVRYLDTTPLTGSAPHAAGGVR
jgi:ketosteroid isomerase-like protein